MGRMDFFSSLYDLFGTLPDITLLHKLEDAYVPVVKFCYSG